jgi:Glycosyltransferase family 87
MSVAIGRVRAFAEFLVVMVATGAFAFSFLGVAMALLGSNAASTRDFVEYWAGGQQLVHHADPYSVNEVTLIERSMGYPAEAPAIMIPNLPPSLPLVLPLGFLSPRVALLLWELLLIGCLIASIEMLRQMHGRPRNLIHLLGYAFAPVLSCLLSGQVTIFVMFGLVLFLRYHLSHPFWAGAALWLCLLKPHLFLPFGVVLILWIVYKRSYWIAAGTAASVIVGGIIATALNPAIWADYAQMMRTLHVDRVEMPCIGSILRRDVSPHTFWLQCLPAAIGCLWAIGFYLKQRKSWNWIDGGAILMLVGLLVTPYTWFMDQAILLPALLHGAYLTRSRTMIAILALMSAVVEIGILRGLALLHSGFYLWTVPAFLVWYLVAIRMRGTAVEGAESGLEAA